MVVDTSSEAWMTEAEAAEAVADAPDDKGCRLAEEAEEDDEVISLFSEISSS